jgi:hypothetical protein
MTRNHWEYRWTPLFSNLMDIAVADSGICDIQGDIMLTQGATLKFEGG